MKPGQPFEELSSLPPYARVTEMSSYMNKDISQLQVSKHLFQKKEGQKGIGAPWCLIGTTSKHFSTATWLIQWNMGCQSLVYLLNNVCSPNSFSFFGGGGKGIGRVPTKGTLVHFSKCLPLLPPFLHFSD